jgi:hypothetical protein
MSVRGSGEIVSVLGTSWLAARRSRPGAIAAGLVFGAGADTGRPGRAL